MDHWTEEYKAELAEKSKDPTQTCAFPAKALRDVSFLLGYVQDDLQFKGPHFARTIDIIKQVSDEDRSYMSEVNHPVHVIMADGDNILNNAEIKRFYEVVKTPEPLKELAVYDSDHYIMSDGWIYEGVLQRAIAWLEKYVVV
jgi:esterase/lipase